MRADFAGKIYAQYDKYVQKRLSEGDPLPLKDVPAEFQKTRDDLSGETWAVWRGNPKIVEEDPDNYEPMCQAYNLFAVGLIKQLPSKT
jgi:hypothetical protein